MKATFFRCRAENRAPAKYQGADSWFGNGVPGGQRGYEWILGNPTNAAPDFRGKSHLGDYSDSLMELDADIGKVMDELRADAPNTIVILTGDNGSWLDAYPDAGTIPFRGEKGWRLKAAGVCPLPADF